MSDRADVDALEAHAETLWWEGRVEEYCRVADDLHRGLLADGRVADAAMVGLEAAVTLYLRGDEGRGSGWMARVEQLTQELPEAPVHGYVAYVVQVEGALDGKDLHAVVDAAVEVQRIGQAHGDANLVACGLVGEGRSRLRLGEVALGSARLDQAMVAVLRDDLDPGWAGNVYCHIMAACHEIGDIARARTWTDATTEWLAALPAAALFTGICRVHRSQVLQVAGDWALAEAEARRVCEELADLSVATVAEAHYQVGELRRLRGDLDAAETAYAHARDRGRDPQPGLALLRLAQGRADVAAAGIEVAVRAATDRVTRARMCAAQVEIALATADLDTARRACADLESAADAYGTSGLEAGALHWRGAVALEAGRPDEALPALRAACRRWHEVHARYEAARACALLGRAYRLLGDEDAAGAELESARRRFEELGADVDERRVRGLVEPTVAARPGGLTAREVEVLSLVTTGMTNREVADALTVSPKTIARHLSNIFTKWDVSTRTEAAAVAHDLGIVPSVTRRVPGRG